MDSGCEKMKILLISSSVFRVPPSSYGGLERIVYDLGIELAKKGHDVTVAAPKGSQAEGCKILEMCDEMPRGMSWPEWERRSYDVYSPVIDQEKYDIIHDHSWFAYIYLKKSQRPELKVLHTHHGEMAWQTPPPVHFANMVGISKDNAKGIMGKFPITVKHAYNGVDLDLYKFNPGPRKDYYLFLSRISHIKGAHLAIGIAQRQRVKLVVAGGDTFVDSPQYVQQTVEQCDGSQITYLGEVPHEKKLELLNNAKALLFPTIMREPFGLVPVEAMATGCPVISSDYGALPEVVQEGGVVCKTVDDMEKAVDEFERGNAPKPEAARANAEKFSREKMCDRYLELYKEILEGREW